MKMGRRGRSSCQDVNRKNKSPFSRCVMAQNGFTAGDEFFNLHGGGGAGFSNFHRFVMKTLRCIIQVLTSKDVFVFVRLWVSLRDILDNHSGFPYVSLRA